MMFVIGGADAEDPQRQVEIHGFVSQGYLKSSRNDYLGHSQRGSFDFNEAGVNASGQVAPNLRAGLQLFARDLGDLGDDRVELDWAYVDYRMRDWLGVRAGRIRLPAGLYNETRDIDLARTCVLLPQSVYPEAYRDALSAYNGLCLYGNLDLRKIGRLDYQTYAGGTNLDTDGSVAQATEDSGPLTVDAIDVKYLCGASLMWHTPAPGLTLGGTWTRDVIVEDETVMLPPPFGPQPTSTLSTINIFIVSAEYTLGDLQVAVEGQRMDGRVTGANALVPTTIIDQGGWYVSAAYRFSQRLEVGSYYSEFDLHVPHRSSNDPDTYQRDLALSLRVDFSDNWLAKLEGHWIRGYSQLLRTENLGPTGAKEAETDWLLLALKTTVSF